MDDDDDDDDDTSTDLFSLDAVAISYLVDRVRRVYGISTFVMEMGDRMNAVAPVSFQKSNASKRSKTKKYSVISASATLLSQMTSKAFEKGCDGITAATASDVGDTESIRLSHQRPSLKGNGERILGRESVVSSTHDECSLFPSILSK